MTRIAVYLHHPEVECWNFSQDHASRLRRLVPNCSVTVCRSQADFLVALPATEIAVVWRFRQEWFDIGGNLRVVATPAAGRDYFFVNPPPGVEVFHGQFHGELMAETVVGMLLAMTRGILKAADLQRDTSWPRADVAAGMRSLRGSHVVILGFGSIGRWIGRLLKPFGIRLTGVCRTRTDRADFMDDLDTVLVRSGLEQVLPSADHLVLCLPGTAETDDVLNVRTLGLLPPHATLCNIGRGNAVDEDALVQALHEGRLSGACLDVCRNEPLPSDSVLRSCPNLWIMPHASAISPAYLDLFVGELATRLARIHA
ncbi:MAG: D-2-hydroxyacid dehydrogenase [Lentisphaeria bacterium]|nr:D-2-hydroxyacid dehydrogenase [Lentisphaeria bacterium]